MPMPDMDERHLKPHNETTARSSHDIQFHQKSAFIHKISLNTYYLKELEMNRSARLLIIMNAVLSHKH